MAKPTTENFADFVVLLGDGATPENFVAPCGFTNKALKLTAQSSSTILPDCDDPTAPAWTAKAVTALDGQVTGAGVLAQESNLLWIDWFISGLSKNIKIQRAGGTWTGAAILTDISDSVQLNAEGNRVQRSVTIDNDGQWTWTPA